MFGTTLIRRLEHRIFTTMALLKLRWRKYYADPERIARGTKGLG
jgi:hypothetical protein